MRLLAAMGNIVGLDVTPRTGRAVAHPGQNSDAQRRVLTKLCPYLGQAFVGFEVAGVEQLGRLIVT